MSLDFRQFLCPNTSSYIQDTNSDEMLLSMMKIGQKNGKIKGHEAQRRESRANPRTYSLQTQQNNNFIRYIDLPYKRTRHGKGRLTQ